MRYGSVSEPFWSEAFLVGGGASLQDFNFDCLKGRTVVAINDAVRRVPWATALFSLDVNWASHRISEITEFAGEAYLALPDEGMQEIPKVVYLRRSRNAGLSSDSSTICMGGNSGYGALNVAFLKKARRIVLLGFDFCLVKGQKHWHQGYSWDQTPSMRYFESWAKNFDATLSQLQAAGIQVFNASPISRIQTFPKIPLDRIFEEAVCC